MSEEWPKITSRKIIKISQWMDVMAREVEFSKGEAPQTYYAVSQLDYLAILAVTADGRIPIVHQYRPAVEAFTWELPAGLLEKGEDAAQGASRELLEETGYPAKNVRFLGSASACTDAASAAPSARLCRARPAKAPHHAQRPASDSSCP